MDTQSGSADQYVVPTKLRILKLLTNAWSWLFLAFIIVFFEVWSWIVYERTFFGNLYNLQAVLLTATQILMMALGLTFIIISAGIDLSIGFIAGLAAVTMAVVIRALPDLPPALSFTLGVMAGIGVALIPGMINGWLISRLKVPSFIGTLGMFGVKAIPIPAITPSVKDSPGWRSGSARITTAIVTAAKPAINPIDKSIPAEMIMNVSPNAIIKI